jgi:voltage-gated potassium channel
VVPLLLAFRGLARAIVAVWRDPETRALPLVAGALVLTGTIFYWRFEDWTIIEALYFSVVTVTTIGLGDLTPTSAGTQIFTIIYMSATPSLDSPRSRSRRERAPLHARGDGLPRNEDGAHSGWHG